MKTPTERSPGTNAVLSLIRLGHNALTPRDMGILKAIACITRERGMPPTVRDICRHLDCAINNVSPPLKKLRRLGLLCPLPGKGSGRCLVLTCRLEVLR